MRVSQFFLIIVFIFSLTACSGVHRVKTQKKNTFHVTKTNNSISGRAQKVLNKAFEYIGTPYKYGGTNSSGMDCSGLVWTSFQEVGISLPRVSSQQADFGIELKKKEIQPGDALFFNTSGKKISHVGIVDHIEEGEIFFIHASTSQGVTVSSLENSYWKPRFIKAVRFLH